MKKFLTMLLAIPLLFGVVMATPVGTVAEDNGNDPVSKKIILYAGQNMEVGWVDVDNDGANLYVTYHITKEGWCMTETHLNIEESENDFPMAGGKVKNVVPGQFDYKEYHDPCTREFSYPPIPLEEWGSVDNLIIAAHAVVRNYEIKTTNQCLYSGDRTAEEIYDKVIYLEEDPQKPGYPVGWSAPYQTYPNDPVDSVLTWSHSAWGPYGVSGAKWIGSAELAENTDHNTWRLFTREFDLPEDATNIAGTLTMNADNAEESYLNDNFVLDGYPAFVYGESTRNVYPPSGVMHGWNTVEGPVDVSSKLVAGSNELWTMTRNYAWSGGFYANPTGLIYSLCYSYDQVEILGEETAWAATAPGVTRFTTKGNWATYFTYDIKAMEKKLTGDWLLSINNEAYLHDMTIEQLSDGSLIGTGGYPSTGPPYLFPYNWTLTGNLSGNSVSMTIYYENSYTATITGTVDDEFGSMSGGPGTGGVSNWSATKL